MKILRKDRAPKIEPDENTEKPVADFENYQKLFEGQLEVCQSSDLKEAQASNEFQKEDGTS